MTEESETRWHFLLHCAKHKVGIGCIPKLPAIISILPTEGKITNRQIPHTTQCVHTHKWQKPSERWWVRFPARGMTNNRPRIYSDFFPHESSFCASNTATTKHMKGFHRALKARQAMNISSALFLFLLPIIFQFGSGFSLSSCGRQNPWRDQNSVPRGDYPT